MKKIISILLAAVLALGLITGLTACDLLDNGGKNIDTYAITATSNNNAYGTVTGAGTYDKNDTVTLTAVANADYVFENWTENGTIVNSSIVYNFPSTKDRNLVANFKAAPPQEFTITVAANNSNLGTVIGMGTYEKNNIVTVTAIVKTGYVFENWTEYGTQCSTNTTYIFSATNDRNLVANFKVAINVEGGTGSGNYDYGSSVTIKVSEWINFLYFANTNKNTVLAYRDKVDYSKGYTFTATENMNIKAVHTENLVGYGIVGYNDISNDPNKGVEHASVANISGFTYFYERIDDNYLMFTGPHPQPVRNIDGYTVKYTMQAKGYSYVSTYIIVWIPETNSYRAFFGSRLGNGGNVTASVKNPQNGRTYAIEIIFR